MEDSTKHTNHAPRPALTLGSGLKPRTWDERIAFWISQVASPPMMALLALVLITITLAVPNRWIWSGIYMLLVMIIPLIYLIAQVHKGSISDLDVQRKEQRNMPFIVTIGGAALTWIIMQLGNAPIPLLTMAAAVTVQGLCIFLITQRWKISVHSATAAGMTVLILRFVGISAVPLAITVPLVAWSRIRLRHHTPAQTLAGILVGSAVFLVVLSISALL